MHQNNRPIILAVLIMLFICACQPIQEPQPTAAPTPTIVQPPPTVAVAEKVTLELVADEITSKALEGNLLGDPATRKFYVLLPPSYRSSDRHYPAVYVLPWGTSTPESNVSGFKQALERLYQTNDIKEMILVFPDGSNSLGASLFRSSPTIGDYETYLVQELVDYVDANYRTLAKRESRALAGCSNGGDATMRLALKYPNVFSVAAPSGGVYDETLAENEDLLQELELLRTLPESANDVAYQTSGLVAWYIQTAAGSASNPDNPPLFLDMPFWIVDGKAEIVPEVADRIEANDAAHEAARYVEQPYRLNGLLIQHALYDMYNPTEVVRSFDQLLTDLGIEHEYVEEEVTHCSGPWEATSIDYISEHLEDDAG